MFAENSGNLSKVKELKEIRRLYTPTDTILPEELTQTLVTPVTKNRGLFAINTLSTYTFTWKDSKTSG